MPGLSKATPQLGHSQTHTASPDPFPCPRLVAHGCQDVWVAPSCATLAINSHQGFNFRPWARCPEQGRAGLVVEDHSGAVRGAQLGAGSTSQRE